MYVHVRKHETMYVHVRNDGDNLRWTAPRRLLAMAERCRIPKRSAEAIEAERRASINAERQRLGLSRSEAARMLPGAEFLIGKRTKSQQTGERAEHFKTEQRSSTMAAARDAAAARHRQLLHGQERLQAAAARKEALMT